ncbi:MAG: nuclear transport factor 2 family protein [Bacilli bacterium]|nr:nuclear transport factor 2 family protein [Bacilli bacterium]
MKDKYDNWTKEFMDSWKDLDWKRTLETLSKDVEYYENPIDSPCKSFDEVINLWNVVADNQKDIEYKYEIVVFDEKNCIINWQMTRTMTSNNVKQEIDGIFQISLNNEGKCTYFKQWRYTR